jgi:CBS domain-containing membrane protein
MRAPNARCAAVARTIVVTRTSGARSSRVAQRERGAVLAAPGWMAPVLVKDIMTAPVVTLFAEQTLPLAEDIMRFKHLRHLPVVDDANRLVGLVSHRDILRAQISGLTGLSARERRARQDDVRMSQIMTRDVWTATPETWASNAGRVLLDHAFGCLPVVGRDHTLIGIVTERDFLKLAIKAIAALDGA